MPLLGRTLDELRPTEIIHGGAYWRGRDGRRMGGQVRDTGSGLQGRLEASLELRGAGA